MICTPCYKVNNWIRMLAFSTLFLFSLLFYCSDMSSGLVLSRASDTQSQWFHDFLLTERRKLNLINNLPGAGFKYWPPGRPSIDDQYTMTPPQKSCLVLYSSCPWLNQFFLHLSLFFLNVWELFPLYFYIIPLCV